MSERNVELENRADPRAHIESIRAQIASMGANDAEISELDGIVAELTRGKMLPEKAVEQAEQILARKMGYH
ncbi:MAG: hypothetical protein A3C90_04420 [Candidatus Magasanikbacteria bacterium RIFCSPHIGHO2_02_FULL_51_14]|uniref:Antitoxin VbhA domain-containing protein n=1 Tax=Candidatus Magasanikbacteria bacterium RIFCSPHIGHO2_02_FULL_51_14 TaxID=1798683 RepID=A0A1F6MPY9_9BACT|nr:MAG: hypothetical protein A3C90_04420 [Candidatus Magasanikbacteria bacterium RIFCSPHIGHO2_02_FULL_51_14]